MFKIIENKNALNYGGVNMDADNEICNIAPPLDVIRSGSLIGICGSSGSGKTSLMVQMISKRGKNKAGYKNSFRNCFHRIILCSPSLHTLKGDIMKIPENQKYDNFAEMMDDIEGYLDESKDEDEPQETLLILDDVATSLRNSGRQYELQLVRLLQNRRHKRLSCICTVQSYRQFPTQLRNNCNVMFLFSPKTSLEREAITEILPIHKKHALDLFNFVFDRKHRHLMIDMTLRKSDKYLYFKDFQQIEFL